MRPVIMNDGSPEDHPAAGRFLLAPRSNLIGKPVLNVDVSLLEDADAIASRDHVFGWVQLNLDDDGALDLLLDTRCRVLSADFAGLVEHVGGDFTDVRSDKDLYMIMEMF